MAGRRERGRGRRTRAGSIGTAHDGHRCTLRRTGESLEWTRGASTRVAAFRITSFSVVPYSTLFGGLPYAAGIACTLASASMACCSLRAQASARSRNAKRWE